MDAGREGERQQRVAALETKLRALRAEKADEGRRSARASPDAKQTLAEEIQNALLLFRDLESQRREQLGLPSHHSHGFVDDAHTLASQISSVATDEAERRELLGFPPGVSLDVHDILQSTASIRSDSEEGKGRDSNKYAEMVSEQDELPIVAVEQRLERSRQQEISVHDPWDELETDTSGSKDEDYRASRDGEIVAEGAPSRQESPYYDSEGDAGREVMKMVETQTELLRKRAEIARLELTVQQLEMAKLEVSNKLQTSETVCKRLQHTQESLQEEMQDCHFRLMELQQKQVNFNYLSQGVVEEIEFTMRAFDGLAIGVISAQETYMELEDLASENESLRNSQLNLAEEANRSQEKIDFLTLELQRKDEDIAKWHAQDRETWNEFEGIRVMLEEELNTLNAQLGAKDEEIERMAMVINARDVESERLDRIKTNEIEQLLELLKERDTELGQWKVHQAKLEQEMMIAHNTQDAVDAAIFRALSHARDLQLQSRMEAQSLQAQHYHLQKQLHQHELQHEQQQELLHQQELLRQQELLLQPQPQPQQQQQQQQQQPRHDFPASHRPEPSPQLQTHAPASLQQPAHELQVHQSPSHSAWEAFEDPNSSGGWVQFGEEEEDMVGHHDDTSAQPSTLGRGSAEEQDRLDFLLEHTASQPPGRMHAWVSEPAEAEQLPVRRGERLKLHLAPPPSAASARDVATMRTWIGPEMEEGLRRAECVSAMAEEALKYARESLAALEASPMSVPTGHHHADASSLGTLTHMRSNSGSSPDSSPPTSSQCSQPNFDGARRIADAEGKKGAVERRVSAGTLARDPEERELAMRERERGLKEWEMSVLEWEWTAVVEGRDARIKDLELELRGCYAALEDAREDTRLLQQELGVAERALSAMAAQLEQASGSSSSERAYDSSDEWPAAERRRTAGLELDEVERAREELAVFLEAEAKARKAAELDIAAEARRRMEVEGQLAAAEEELAATQAALARLSRELEGADWEREAARERERAREAGREAEREREREAERCEWMGRAWAAESARREHEELSSGVRASVRRLVGEQVEAARALAFLLEEQQWLAEARGRGAEQRQGVDSEGAKRAEQRAEAEGKARRVAEQEAAVEGRRRRELEEREQMLRREIERLRAQASALEARVAESAGEVSALEQVLGDARSEAEAEAKAHQRARAQGVAEVAAMHVRIERERGERVRAEQRAEAEGKARRVAEQEAALEGRRRRELEERERRRLEEGLKSSSSSSGSDLQLLLGDPSSLALGQGQPTVAAGASTRHPLSSVLAAQFGGEGVHHAAAGKGARKASTASSVSDGQGSTASADMHPRGHQPRPYPAAMNPFL